MLIACVSGYQTDSFRLAPPIVEVLLILAERGERVIRLDARRVMMTA